MQHAGVSMSLTRSVPRNQVQGRLRLTDAKPPGVPVLSPFAFLDTTAPI